MRSNREAFWADEVSGAKANARAQKKERPNHNVFPGDDLGRCPFASKERRLKFFLSKNISPYLLSINQEAFSSLRSILFLGQGQKAQTRPRPLDPSRLTGFRSRMCLREMFFAREKIK